MSPTIAMMRGGVFARVSLDASDMALGRDEAAQRLSNGKSKRDRVPTPDVVRARNECESCRAELAVMRYTGAPIRFARAPSRDHNPDVLPDVEVRWRSKRWHDLIIRNSDVLPRRFVLVKGVGPTFVLCGWIYGTEAEQHPSWRHDPGRYGLTSWLISEKDLHPMSTLAKYGERQR